MLWLGNLCQQIMTAKCCRSSCRGLHPTRSHNQRSHCKRRCDEHTAVSCCHSARNLKKMSSLQYISSAAATVLSACFYIRWKKNDWVNSMKNIQYNQRNPRITRLPQNQVETYRQHTTISHNILLLRLCSCRSYEHHCT